MMRAWSISLYERLTSGARWSLEDALLVALLASLFFASVHLMSLLLTRWGDRNATAKSFICSLLLHACFIMGAATVNPPSQAVAEPSTIADEQPQVRIQQLNVESEEPVESEEQGNTPIWDKLTDPLPEELTRVDREIPEPEPNESLDRKPEDPPFLPEAGEPDLASLPERPNEIPALDRRGAEGPLRETARPRRIDDPAPNPEPVQRTPTPRRVRRTFVPGDRVDIDVSRSPSRGTADRIDDGPQPQRTLASINAADDPAAFLKRAADDTFIRRRTAPAPSPVREETTGTAGERPTKGSAAGERAPRRIVRSTPRSPRSSGIGSIERRRPSETPRTPNPDGNREVAVRRGLPVEIPRTGRSPNIVRPDIETVRRGTTANLPPTYRLRDLARRKDIARRFGGTEASETAVEASLKWLASAQDRAGYWDADAHGGGRVKIGKNGRDDRGALVGDKPSGLQADSGVTALALLAFLGAGYTHEEGPYADQVGRAVHWLIRQQRDDGYLGGKANRYAGNYCHAMAAYALAEAYGMQSDPTIDTGLRQPLLRAIGYIVRQQNPDGGWRYEHGQDSDMSMFGWQLMALKSADIAGIPMPAEARQKMVKFLKSRSFGRRKGLASYRHTPAEQPSTLPTPAMTAEALFCKQMLGISREDPASSEAAEYLMRHLPRLSKLNLYYWYYGTLAMYQYGGEPWRKWNGSLRDRLVSEQRKLGKTAGSWDPKGPWGAYGGRVYSTALSALSLEVYYRFLPLYQMGGRYEER